MPGRPAEKFDAILQTWMPKIGADVDFEVIQQTPEHWDFNITGCRYADFFRQLGEPELGALLLCEQDVHVTDVVGPTGRKARTHADDHERCAVLRLPLEHEAERREVDSPPHSDSVRSCSPRA